MATRTDVKVVSRNPSQGITWYVEYFDGNGNECEKGFATREQRTDWIRFNRKDWSVKVGVIYRKVRGVKHYGM